ncbi:HAMP domain-containing protein [Synechococcales cyanobacterium C]|uniref:HAMP domain-containing protein n=1 Tax=Petrachloros mirabilis ULC683 TaxID=2781853 RepID=A0A8K2A201_9CYAN|nr:HAMP domain-containing methyl-accepting chemotaxis protein [Petrachloros mirabilis]NCJ08243.1 HAMP domain-containing protein [Petrachloros mirabilis ULC683]
MAFSTQYAQDYQEAVSAYMKGNYDEAASNTDRLIQEYPTDPNLRLLRGHIDCCLQQYSKAVEHYQSVLTLTHDAELLDCARISLAEANQYLPSDEGSGLQMIPNEPATQLAISQPTSPTEFFPVQVDNLPEDATQLQGLTASAPGVTEQDPKTLTGLIDPFALGSFEGSGDSAYPSELDEDEDVTLFKTDPPPPDPQLQHPGAAEVGLPDASAREDKFSEDAANPISSPTQSLAPYADEVSDLLTQTTPSWHDGSPAQTQELGAFEDLHSTPDFTETQQSDLEPSGEGSLNFHEEEDREDLDTELFGTVDEVPSLSLAQPPSSPHGLVTPGMAAAPSGYLPLLSETSASPVGSQQSKGIFAPYIQASLQQKQAITATAVGAISALAVVATGQMTQSPWQFTGLGALAAGLAGGATTLAFGQVLTKQIKNSTNDLNTQLTAVAQGDWSVKAAEYSNDEFGQLAKSFNQMARFIEATTKEVQRKAEDQEKSKEDLQRQVIRLLDDVEGAARGDLTVQAEVTADILGAVADSFNLTIYNLQKIVKQVKVAAREVNRGAAENEEFARGLSSDALRQAEELAVTLNSVQLMTNSIQEVAESARAADQVAQRASEAALKGGESVERTVAGILQIRETVAETTRKVKRLAESSQEISKIVGLISQIASRTNLLALNASIEAARAGESGRGFAVVADEVRQLADRAAKSSKEIEQIVLQIQGETSSVMTAMEEGTQQVIEGTQRAEQAKRSLEDIIQVSSQINQLVGSITQATSEQTETSRYVAQVMQSVELTAQETSQEAQRVSDSLRNLVGVARDLQSSVERFRVDGTEFSGRD